MDLEGLGRSRRRRLAPEVLGEALGRDHAVRRQDQTGQEGTLAAARQDQAAVVHHDFERP
jgi:hypothetical protein